MLETIIITAVGSILAPIIHAVCNNNDEPSDKEPESNNNTQECDGYYSDPEPSGSDHQTSLSDYGFGE